MRAVLVVLVLAATVLAVPAGGRAAGAIDVYGLDAHDGMAYQVGSTYYIVGTRYGCGFTWGQPGTPWCGFGVWSSTDKVSWTYLGLLFDPSSLDDTGMHTWQWTCGSDGAGCFNPRMAQRYDGVWVLWFNAPGDFNRSRGNAYYAMGCNGPAGPCGATAGPPYGSTHKPALWICAANGDASLVMDGPTAYLVCTQPDQTLSLEELDIWWTNGTNRGATELAGVHNVEAPAIYHDSLAWVLTYSDPSCGYCSGTATGYATAPMLPGPWAAPQNLGVSAPLHGRRVASGASCGGQPRSIAMLDGSPYQWIDLWVGTLNEAQAGIHLEPLRLNGLPGPPDGRVLSGGLSPFTCV